MPHRFGQILITVPGAPEWAAVPYLVRHNERRPGVAVHPPREQIQPGSIEFCLTLSGSGTMRHGAATVPLPKGTVVLLRPGVDGIELSGASHSPPWRCLRVCLHGTWAGSAAAALITQHGHRFASDADMAIWRELVAEIPGGFGHARIWSLEQALVISARMFSAIVPNRPEQEPNDPLVAAALQLMHEVQTLGSLADVASRLHVSREHLSRKLTAAGYEPSKHFRRLRLERAVALLANRHLSIAEIMRRCGWKSQAAFARAITAISGKSPRAHRRDRTT